MADDVLAAMLAAIERRADDTDLPRMPRNPRSTANSNHPFKPEYQRPPRNADPDTWSAPSYRDRDAERVVGRLSPKKKGK